VGLPLHALRVAGGGHGVEAGLHLIVAHQACLDDMVSMTVLVDWVETYRPATRCV
jgi:hypothetical protein